MKKMLYRFYLILSALLIISGGAALAWTMHLGASKLPLRQYFSRAYTNAVWDWASVETKSPQDLRTIADFMYMHQLNAAFVTVGGRYQTIAKIKDATQQAAARQQFEDALSRYVAALAKRSIKVYAAAGDVSWSDQDKQTIPLAILHDVEDYNAHHPQTSLTGVEFDIEAYNQPGFASGSMTVKSLGLTDWLDMVDLIARENAAYTNDTGQKLEIGFAIPYWFDNENGNIPEITWHDKTGPTLYHLLDRLNSLTQSNVVVMAYRNAARGNDGVVYHSRTEVEYAQAKTPHVKVLIGQEVNDVQPAKITYYGHSATELSSQVTATEDGFQGNSAFGGIAINDLAGFQQLDSGR